MSRHINTRPATPQSLASLPPSLQISTALGAFLAVAGVALVVLAWTGPLEEPTTSQIKNGTRMDFSYTADVGQSPAYDGPATFTGNDV